MPLHDWRNEKRWSELHTYWLVNLATHLKTLLPPGYRPHVGTVPALTVGIEAVPDVSVVGSPGDLLPPGGDGEDLLAPDFDATVAVLDPPEQSVLVEYQGILVAAVELVSPNNKHGPDKRTASGAKYLTYLRQMVNLLIVDLLPKPYGFSFPDLFAKALELPDQPACPAPVAASYRMDGRSHKESPRVTIWRRPLAVGQPLPTLPLALTPTLSVMVDLEPTYMQSAASAYVT